MAVTAKWRRHIDAWKSSGLSQSEYCEQHGINVRTFAARLSDFRKRSMAESVAIVPVQIESNSQTAIALLTPAKRKNDLNYLPQCIVRLEH